MFHEISPNNIIAIINIEAHKKRKGIIIFLKLFKILENKSFRTLLILWFFGKLNILNIFDNRKKVKNRVNTILIIIKIPNVFTGFIFAVRNEANPTIVVIEAKKIVGKIDFVE